MQITLLEKRYNNRVRSSWDEVEVSARDGGIWLDASNEDVDVSLCVGSEEIQHLWSQLLKQDTAQAKKVSERFSENLAQAHSLATRLNLDQYQDDAGRLEDMKRFVQIYTDLVEHAKFGLASKKTLEQEQKAGVDAGKAAGQEEKEPQLDEEAKKIADISEERFPRRPLFQDDAIELAKILEDQERRKKEIKEEEEKRLKELQEEAKEKKGQPAPAQDDGQKKDTHLDTDYVTVRPLFSEGKGMDKASRRSADLDTIDYSRL